MGSGETARSGAQPNSEQVQKTCIGLNGVGTHTSGKLTECAPLTCSPLAKIKPGQPHYHLPIAGSDFPTPRPEIPERTYYCRPHVEDIPSSSDAPPPPYSTAPPSFDFQEMMTLLHRMDTGITANTAAIQGISQQVDANGVLLQNLSQRVDTLANDQHLAFVISLGTLQEGG